MKQSLVKLENDRLLFSELGVARRSAITSYQPPDWIASRIMKPLQLASDTDRKRQATETFSRDANEVKSASSRRADKIRSVKGKSSYPICGTSGRRRLCICSVSAIISSFASSRSSSQSISSAPSVLEGKPLYLPSTLAKIILHRQAV